MPPNPTDCTLARAHLDNPEGRARFQALWESAPDRSVLTSLAYADCVAEAFGLSCELTFCGQGTDECGITTFFRQTGPYRIGRMPPFTLHTGPLYRSPPSEATINQRRSALEGLLQAVEGNYSALRYQLLPSVADVRVFGWRGWTARPFYTYRAAIGEEDPFARWSRRTRRIAANHAAAYIFAEEPGAAREAARLCNESLDRQEHPRPVSTDALERFVQAAVDRKLARIFTLRADREASPEAALAVLVGEGEAFYWVGGSVPGPAMTVLLGQAIPLLAASGVHTMDYLGANTPSIAEFKRHFGGTLTPYFGVEKVMRPELRLLEKARALQRRLWRK